MVLSNHTLLKRELSPTRQSQAEIKTYSPCVGQAVWQPTSFFAKGIFKYHKIPDTVCKQDFLLNRELGHFRKQQHVKSLKGAGGLDSKGNTAAHWASEGRCAGPTHTWPPARTPAQSIGVLRTRQVPLLLLQWCSCHRQRVKESLMLHTRLVSASSSQSPGLSPGVSWFSGPLLQGTATEPAPWTAGTCGRRFPGECSWARYLIDCSAPGLSDWKRAQTLSNPGLRGSAGTAS